MDSFSGTEPLVGEIVGLRTFRVDDSGRLLPLYSSGVWYDGPNTAVCSPPTGDHRSDRHRVPDNACECGFYAYGTREAAAQNRHTRYVQAVVSCWGDIVAGTQGVRAERARIDAIWLHPEAPRGLRSRVAGRYPSARLYADRDAMLGEHPLTELSCYDRPRRVRPSTRLLAALAFLAVLALGLVPVEQLRGTDLLWDLWIVVTGATVALIAWLIVGTHGVGHLAAAIVVGGLLAWLVAPLFGLPGWLLRLPLLRGFAVAVGGYLLTLRPHYFPIVRTPRERSFCGVSG